MKKTLIRITAILSCHFAVVLASTLTVPTATAGQQIPKAYNNEAWRTTVQAIRALPPAQQPEALLAALRNNGDLRRGKLLPQKSMMSAIADELGRINHLPENERGSAVHELIRTRKTGDMQRAKSADRHAAPALADGLRSESEPNENANDANTLTPGTMIAGNTSTGADEDWFAFSANAGDIVDIFAFAQEFHSTLDAYLVLYDSDGATILTFNDDYEERDPRILYKISATGTYYLQLTAFDAEALGEYELSLTMLGNGRENEPNNEITSANVLATLPQAAIAEIGQKDDSDFYTITLDAGETVGVRLESVEGDALPDMVLAVYDNTGLLLAVNDDHLGGRFFNAELAFKNTAAAPAVFYLQAATFLNQEVGNYVVSARPVQPAPPSTWHAALGDSGGGRILSLDAATGAASFVGFSLTHGASALAINNLGEIYATRDDAKNTAIFRIDPVTGNGFGLAAIFDLEHVRAIAFDSQNRLYAFNHFSELHLLDLAAKASTKILNLPGDSDVIQGMAFDPKNGDLFVAAGSEIWRTDLATGIPVLVGSTGFAEPTSEIFFDREGRLFGVKGGPAQNNTLFTIDKSSAAITAIGETGYSAIDGMAAAVDHLLDVQLDSIIAPVGSKTFGANEQITIAFSNRGTLYQRNVPVTFQLRGPSTATAAENTGSFIISPGQQATYTFQRTVDLQATGQYTLDVYLSASGDENSGNDTLSVGIQSGTTSVGNEKSAPTTFALHQNYPNPFNPGTSIAFELPRAQHVTLTLYNAIGQKVRTLLDSDFIAGRHSVSWDGTTDKGVAAPSGLYFYKMQAGEFSALKKLILMR